MPEESHAVITVESEMLSTDPPVVIHHVQVKNEKAEWRETYGSTLEVEAFLRGAEAYASMLGTYFDSKTIVRKQLDMAARVVRSGP